jgi:sortase A
MEAHIYTKAKRKNYRKPLRFVGLGLIFLGLLFGLYAFFPLLSWQLYLRPVFASSNFASPIPQTTIMTQETIQSLLTNSLNGSDWLPAYYQEANVGSTITHYTLSIPKIKIDNAEVSAIDTDLSSHLVHFPGTALPPMKGNAVIFGHSTLPQLYNPTNYKTIFANIHNLIIGDKLLIKVNEALYTYKIISISIVDAENTSYLTQQSDDTYLTIVTCTPPGTVWKRLIIKSKLEKIEG